MVAGPVDMNNGMFDLRQGHTTRVDESQPVPSTLVSEAARTLINFFRGDYFTGYSGILPEVSGFVELLVCPEDAVEREPYLGW